MKRLIIFLFVIVGIISCKDDEDPVISGSFTFDGNNFSLAKGFLDYRDNFVVAGYTYNIWAVILTSDGISFGSSFTGTGEVVYLYLYTAIDETTLPAGTYTADGLVGENLIELGETYLQIDATIGGKGGITYADFVSGEVVVSRIGSFHKIDFTLTDVDGRQLTGSLTAPLQRL